MSGGSFNYLYIRTSDELLGRTYDLASMAETLRSLAYAQEAAEDTETLLQFIQTTEKEIALRSQHLRLVWRAVERWRSMDDSELLVKLKAVEYRAARTEYLPQSKQEEEKKLPVVLGKSPVERILHLIAQGEVRCVEDVRRLDVKPIAKDELQMMRDAARYQFLKQLFIESEEDISDGEDDFSIPCFRFPEDTYFSYTIGETLDDAIDDAIRTRQPQQGVDVLESHLLTAPEWSPERQETRIKVAIASQIKAEQSKAKSEADHELDKNTD